MHPLCSLKSGFLEKAVPYSLGLFLYLMLPTDAMVVAVRRTSVV